MTQNNLQNDAPGLSPSEREAAEKNATRFAYGGMALLYSVGSVSLLPDAVSLVREGAHEIMTRQLPPHEPLPYAIAAGLMGLLVCCMPVGVTAGIWGVVTGKNIYAKSRPQPPQKRTQGSRLRL